MNIDVGIEDRGLDLSALIANRTPCAARHGCMLSSREKGTRLANVEVIGCEHDKSKETQTLCAVLADIIIENLQIRYLVQILKRSHSYLSEKDQCDVLVSVLKQLWYPTAKKGIDIEICKNDVRKRLQKAIAQNGADTVMLEGFMRFRMKDYLEVWKKELDGNVKQHVRKKEYVEFVEILRLFVSIRIPREKTIHLCVDGSGDYLLLDEKLYMLNPSIQGADDKDDALLSELVNLAPYHIIVHNKERFEDASMLETIKDVFGKRVEFSDKMI